MRAAIIALMLMIGSQAGADAAKIWKVVSPSVVSVLPTWPGYTKPGFGAPVGAAPEEKRTAAGSSLTVGHPLTMTKTSLHRYSCSGTPADCVVTAMTWLFKD